MIIQRPLIFGISVELQAGMMVGARLPQGVALGVVGMERHHHEGLRTKPMIRQVVAKAQVMAGHGAVVERSEEHTSELQSRQYLVCRLLLEKKNTYCNSLY